MEKHRRTCTGAPVVPTVAVPAAKKRCPGVAPERLHFKLQKTRETLEGNVLQFSVNLKRVKSLSTLEKAIAVFRPVMKYFQQKHSAYKFQIAVEVVFHKAVDPAVVTQSPVVLTSEMVDVYADAPSLNDVNRQLLNFTQVYKQNGSGWVFSNFVSLQLSLWHLDPLRASAFVPLPNWIQTRIAVVNIRGTGNDCFKWAVLAGMHTVDANRDRMSQYTEHVGKYYFSSTSTFSCSSFFCWFFRDIDLLLFERNGIQHYATIRNFSRLVSSQMSNHSHAVYCCKQCLHAYSTRKLLDAHATDCCQARRTKFRCKKYPTMLMMVIYSRWIFTVQLAYMIVTMTTRSPPSLY